MADKIHDEQLKTYLHKRRVHKDKNGSAKPAQDSPPVDGNRKAKQSASNTITSTRITKSSSPQKKVVKTKQTRATYMAAKLAYTVRGTSMLSSFPDELLLKIFSYLGPQDLLLSTQVCSRWNGLANDNLFWKRTFFLYATQKTNQTVLKAPKNPPVGFWKSKCIERGAKARNQAVLPMLKKIDRFTGLPAHTQKALQTAGIRWLLCMVDYSGREHITHHNDVFFFRMTTCIRWYSLQAPPVHSIKQIRIYAANPVMFDKKGQAIKNSPCQRSLLYEVSVKLGDLPLLGEDEVLNLWKLPGGPILATFTNGGELAFVTTTLHNHVLVRRCLQGEPNKMFIPEPHHAEPCDIDSRCGLHSYTCILELRNQRTSYWMEQFNNCSTDRENISDGFARFLLIDPERSYQRSSLSCNKQMSFLWKTDLFKGAVSNVCIMDITLLDERGEPAWCSSSAVKVLEPSSTEVVNYEYDGDIYYITLSEEQGKIAIKLTWEPSEKKYFITSLTMSLSLAFINRWFATAY